MGYPRHIFTSGVSPDLLCLSCEDVFKNPWTSACGHTLCRQCWLNRVHIDEQTQTEMVVCMHCRHKNIQGPDQLKFDADTYTFVMNLMTRCGNSECGRHMPLKDRDLHMEVCKHNDKDLQLCCLKPSKRTTRIIRRGGRIFKAMSRRTQFIKLVRMVLSRALNTYSRKVNTLLAPITSNLQVLEQLIDDESESI